MAQSSSIVGVLKLTTLIGSAFLAALLVTLSTPLSLAQNMSPTDPATIATISMKSTYFADVGNLAIPHLESSLITPEGDKVPLTFLIDSGAKISAIPMSYIDSSGIDKDTAKRIYLRSATDNTTYGYLADVTIDLNGEPIVIPAAFAEVIEPLLGTYGFFDRYTIIFDAAAEKVIIKNKG